MYRETATAYFAVEAQDEDDALARFEEWRIASDNVYTTISNAVHRPPGKPGGLGFGPVPLT